jgi:hypothetical protein
MIFFSLKIRRLRPGANPRTWVPKARTLPLDHRSHLVCSYMKLQLAGSIQDAMGHGLSVDVQLPPFIVFALDGAGWTALHFCRFTCRKSVSPTNLMRLCVWQSWSEVCGRENKSKRIPFIFNDESTGSCICLGLDLYMSHVKSVSLLLQ